jgi:hypothetical protein
VDSIFVARLSENALTATSLAYPMQMFMIAVGVGTGVGANAVLSRNIGSGNREKIENVRTRKRSGTHDRDSPAPACHFCAAFVYVCKILQGGTLLVCNLDIGSDCGSFCYHSDGTYFHQKKLAYK